MIKSCPSAAILSLGNCLTSSPLNCSASCQRPNLHCKRLQILMMITIGTKLTRPSQMNVPQVWSGWQTARLQLTLQPLTKPNAQMPPPMSPNPTITLILVCNSPNSISQVLLGVCILAIILRLSMDKRRKCIWTLLITQLRNQLKLLSAMLTRLKTQAIFMTLRTCQVESLISVLLEPGCPIMSKCFQIVSLIHMQAKLHGP